MSPSTWTHSQLAKRCAQNLRNVTAWEEFVKRYHVWIEFSVARLLRHNGNQALTGSEDLPALIQDLVIDVYIHLLDRRAQALRYFRGRAANSIFAYLAVIAVNVVKNFLARLSADKRYALLESIEEKSWRENYEEKPATEDVIADVRPGAEQALLQGEFLLWTKRQVRVISGEKFFQRNFLIFLLFFAYGLGLEEIARLKIVNLSVPGVNSVLRKITGELSKKMSAQHSLCLREMVAWDHRAVLTQLNQTLAMLTCRRGKVELSRR